ncbi:sensor domain-containing diguanylate cyclase [Marinobacter sp. JSM 1782161]|uniref:sensor domain-containing diguanylate cyclase n=1 Tax=Marinobacter sp. JSM 1782161 TaxID=2685906 RepID=UPI001403A4AA|nr:sensor domain-containing diguanylate cyclase [Marinobacter sp. JSM 1782161]
MRASGKVASPMRRALLICVAYGLVSALWIAISDRVLAYLVADPAVLTRLQTLKGWGFVALTSFLLFLMILHQFRRYADMLAVNQRQAAAIHDLSQFRESVIDNASVWINVLDPDGRVLVWNKAAERISGYKRDEVLHTDSMWTLLYPDDDYRAHVLELAESIIRDGLDLSGFESRIQTKQGLLREMSWNSRRFFTPDGRVAGAITIGQDLTQQHHLEHLAHDSERQLQTLMDNLPGMAYRCLLDERWTMKFVSDGCRALTGYGPDELLENRVVSLTDLLDPGVNEDMIRAVERAIANAEPYAAEYPMTRRDGTRIWVWDKGRSVEVGGQLMLEGIMLDISDRKALEQELARLATHDALTGLYNRRELERRLDEEMIRAHRYGRPVAVLWVDLDHFKAINDRFGHAQGDEVLRRVSQLLQRSIRAMDIAGRYGGEEFVLVLPEHELGEAEETAERLRKLVSEETITIGGQGDVRLSVSIGVAVYPTHGHSVGAVCEAADAAMYAAKRAGRNQVRAAQSAGDS